MLGLRPSLTAALAVCGFVHLSHAATIRVPIDQPTIKMAALAAAPGDTLVIDCGTYFEEDILLQPGIVLRSASDDPACVTLDAQGGSRILLCPPGERETMIEGLTLRRGSLSGLRCDSANVNVTNCRFSENGVAGFPSDVEQC